MAIDGIQVAPNQENATTSLYEDLACQEVFFRDQHFLLPTFQEGSRERSFALMARAAHLLRFCQETILGAQARDNLTRSQAAWKIQTVLQFSHIVSNERSA
jgi:hypothetical protein